VQDQIRPTAERSQGRIDALMGERETLGAIARDRVENADRPHAELVGALFLREMAARCRPVCISRGADRALSRECPAAGVDDSDVGALTCVANISATRMCSRAFLEKHGATASCSRISTSGTSANVINAAQTPRRATRDVIASPAADAIKD